MNLIVVLDDRDGMTFNHRRQSRDRNLTARILERCDGRLIVHPFSADLFAGSNAALTVTETPLADAGPGEWCFAETGSLAPAKERIERLIVYRWNRVYPADQKFDLSLSELKLTSKTDFAGYSHPTLTEEVYEP